jgi:hypothetical protein
MAVHGRSHDKGTGQGRETDIFFEGAPGGGAFPLICFDGKTDGPTTPNREGCIKTLFQNPGLEPRETAVRGRLVYV